jgi:diguanylate cyclase (GGDEF)-like protein
LRDTGDKPSGADLPDDRRPAAGKQGDVGGSKAPTQSDLHRGASDSDRRYSAVEQDSAGADQTGSDSDQTASDSDQTASDADQSAADEDQAASDEDQAAWDQESAEKPDQRVRDMGSVHREHASYVRQVQAHTRLRTAVARDITADERDQTASMRDLAAEIRVPGGTRGGQGRGAESPGLPGIERQDSSPRGDRQTAAADRSRAAADRARAASDRARACEERAQSARDRDLAARDRAQAALDRKASEIDELTHVRRRGAGIKQLQREIDRARRSSERLVVAFVDVDGLKQVNDTKGHLAGDALLVAVTDSLRECLRSYDLIMRFGGDEFVCALPHTDTDKIRQRFMDVSATLAGGPSHGSITVGFAELNASDSPHDLIHRADADLLARREELARRSFRWSPDGRYGS